MKIKSIRKELQEVVFSSQYYFISGREDNGIKNEMPGSQMTLGSIFFAGALKDASGFLLPMEACTPHLTPAPYLVT